MACLETWTFADAVAMSGKCQQRALPRVCANTRLDLFEPPVDCRFIPDHEGPILRSRLISHVDQRTIMSIRNVSNVAADVDTCSSKFFFQKALLKLRKKFR
jgi:hypothetical protein